MRGALARPVAHPEWATDLSLFCRRLAERLHAAGAAHPMAAAVALAVRGRRGLTRQQYAGYVGVSADHLAVLESGAVALADFPPALTAAARVLFGADWAAVAGSAS